MNKKKAPHKIVRTAKLMFAASPTWPILLIVINSVSGLFAPLTLYCSRALIDTIALAITNNLKLQNCIMWMLALTIIVITNNLFSSWVQNAKETYGEIVAKDITSQILDKFEKIPAAQLDDSNTYNKLSIAMQETPEHCCALVDLIGGVIKSFVTVFSLIYMVGTYNYFLPAIIIISTGPLVRLSNYVSKKWYKIYVSQVENSRLLVSLHNLLLNNSNIAELKLFSATKKIKNDILSLMEIRNFEKKRGRFSALRLNFMSTGISGIVTFFLKVWTLIMLVHQQCTIGTITQLISAIENLQSSIRSLVTQLSFIYEQSLYINNVFIALDLPEEFFAKAPAATMNPRCIDFEHVSFTYPGTTRLALENISFCFEKGHIYGLVGVNGSGKSTLIKLLMKLYVPDQGSIKFDRINIQDVDSNMLRRSISAVFQNYIHYPYDIKTNIAISDLQNEKDISRVKTAARKSMADIFIENQEKRYDTQLCKEWEGGVELSTGQWQRIAIARCFFHDAPVRIFDEPFASLDTISMTNIMNSIQNDHSERITLLVTHQPQTLCVADQIILLDRGKIAATGTHETLMKDCALYQKLVKEPKNFAMQ